MTHVRRLAADDWHLLRSARLAALAEAPYAFGSTLAAEKDRPESFWRSWTEKWTWFVALDGDEPRGLVAGWRVDERHELVSMWVAPSHRGSGLAGALVDAVAQWALGDGAAELRLSVVESNERAKRFYERLGFMPTGVAKPFASDPVVNTVELSVRLPALH